MNIITDCEMSEKDELCEKYRKFATERLRLDYEEMIKVVNSIVDEVKEYETLLLFIDKIKVSFKSEKEKLVLFKFMLISKVIGFPGIDKII